MNYKIFSWVLILSGLIFPFSVISPGLAQPNNVECQNELNNLNKKWKAKEGKEWTIAEQFVWIQLCEEDVDEANLTQYKDNDNNKDNDKKLSFKFLKAILLKKEYNEKLPSRIRIRAAVFDEPIDLVSENIDREVSLVESTFKKRVDLSSANFSKSLSFDDSTFDQGIKLSDATIKGTLSFQRVKFKAGRDPIRFKKHYQPFPLSLISPNFDKLKVYSNFNVRSQNIEINDNLLSSREKMNKLPIMFIFRSLDVCRTLVDLKRINVENDLNLSDSTFTCLYQPWPMKENINLVDLRSAKIKVTVNLKRISLIKKNEKDPQKHKKIGVSLVASQIGDAIFIEQGKKIDYTGLVAEEIGDVTFLFINQCIAEETNEQSSQIDYIDMTNVQANGLVFSIDPTIASAIKNYRLFRILHRGSDGYTKLPVQNNYFSDLDIELENANIKKISILANQSQGLELSSNDEDDFSANDEIDFSCKMKLSGFDYSQLNTSAFKFLTICIDSLYRNATRLTETLADRPDQQKKQQEEANRQLIQLLQPIEKLSVVSKSLGVSSVEKDMMYRQKKLEYYLAKTNLSQSKSNFWISLRDFWHSLLWDYSKQRSDNVKIHGSEIFILSKEIFISSWTLASNIFQDTISGYGFHRLRIFYIIIPILIVNFFWALFVSYQKQKKNAYESWYFKTKEIKDEKIGDYRLKQETIFQNEKLSKDIIKQEPLTLQAVSQDIDTILQVIFDSYVEGNAPEQDCFYLYFKYNNDNKHDSYKKIKLDRQEFKYLIGILDNRNPTHTKVGFCKNYYPKGNWSVVTEIKPESPSSLKKVKEVSLYLIERKELIKDIDFQSINPLKFPMKITETIFEYLINFLKSCFKKQLEDINQSEISELGKKTSSGRKKDRKFKQITKFVKRWILFNPLVLAPIVTFVVIFLIPSLILLWHGRKAQAVLSKLGVIVVYQGIFISLILLFILFEIGKFSFKKDKNLAWITRKNLGNAILFSLDILIPIIELDKENLDFILDAAEEYPVIRIYFRMEKLIGPLLISVLLPLLLLTGL